MRGEKMEESLLSLYFSYVQFAVGKTAPNHDGTLSADVFLLLTKIISLLPLSFCRKPTLRVFFSVTCCLSFSFISYIFLKTLFQILNSWTFQETLLLLNWDLFLLILGLFDYCLIFTACFPAVSAAVKVLDRITWKCNIIRWFLQRLRAVICSDRWQSYSHR